MHPALILRTILVSISLMTIPYLSYRFWILRQHFFIESRHPKVTITASISMLITTATLLIVTYFEYFLHGNEQPLWSYNFVGAIGQGFAFVFCALIILRTYLVFDQWKLGQLKLDKMESILKKDTPQTDTIKNRQTWFIILGSKRISKTLVYQITGTIIFMLFIVSTILYYRRHKGDLITMAMIWIITLFIGIFIIFKTRQTKEALSCRKESFIVVTVIFLQLLNANVGAICGFDKFWRYFVATLLSLVCSYALLVISLYAIWNIEHHTIDPEKIFCKDGDQKKRISASLDCQRERVADSKNDVTDLLSYLESKENYDKFTAFLTDCFALESILFFVSAIVFRHILLNRLKEMEVSTQEMRRKSELKDMDIFQQTDLEFDIATPTEAKSAEIPTVASSPDVASANETESEFHDIWHVGNAFCDKLFGLKFAYLDDLYNRYETEQSEYTKIVTEIYSEFIDEDGVHSCNLSSETRAEIKKFIENADNRNKQEIVIIEEYLLLFNKAIFEIWNLMNSVFAFRYKQHLRGAVQSF